MSPHAPRANRIVHIGPGAFHRAHQAVYTHDAMPADGGAWGITAVSLRSTKIADALNAQNGRYTVVTRAASGPEYRVIESITDAVTAAQGLAPVLEALAAPCTRIISLTVTEKAYQPGQSADDMNVIRVLTEALARRKAAGLAGVTLLSCDNLPNNGAVLRSAVLGEARARDPRLADWIERHASFPSTMVDRITPATTPALLDMVAHDTGWADLVPVETEPFSQWIIEDAFVQGRPAWDTAGALLVGDVKPYENMKLRMLNGAPFDAGLCRASDGKNLCARRDGRGPPRRPGGRAHRRRRSHPDPRDRGRFCTLSRRIAGAVQDPAYRP